MRAARRAHLPGVAGAALLAVIVMSLAFVAPGRGAARQSPGPSDEAALKLLRRSADASRTCPYVGVQFISVWSGTGTSTSLVDVAHRPGHGTTMRVRGTGNDPGGSAYTLDDPSQQQAPAGGLSGPTDEQLALLTRNYSVQPGSADDEPATVGGRAADVVEVRRADGTAAARFWIDRSEHLLLRREILDPAGHLVQASAFVSVDYRHDDLGRPGPAAKPPWGDRLDDPRIAALRRSGWPIPRALPGGLSLYAARRGGRPNTPVLHLEYSDGLSVVSLFVQRGRLDDTRPAGWRRVERDRGVLYVSGTVQPRVMWAARGYVYTVIADAPAGTTERVVAALPHESRPGFWTRIGHGLRRVVSWVNPFG